jgi:protein-tyrosine phosphatase
MIVRKKYDHTKVDLLLNEIYPGQNLDIPDPWYGPEAGYHEVYKLIDRACEGIIKKYGNRPQTTDYGRQDVDERP